MTPFIDLLKIFAHAVEANDGRQLAALFTPDGTYEDGFFGAHTGRASIIAMLQRFHDTGSRYLWEFLDPVSDGATGYARFGSAMRRCCRSAWDAPCYSKASSVSGFATV